MAYATSSDLVTAYGAHEVLLSADRDEDGAEDPGVVTRALADASGVMDGYLGKVFELPLVQPYPPLLRALCCDIALYRLSFRPGAEYTKEKRQRYEDALRQLELIAKGDLGLGEGEADQETIGAVAFVEADEREFTSTKIGGLF